MPHDESWLLPAEKDPPKAADMAPDTEWDGYIDDLLEVETGLSHKELRFIENVNEERVRREGWKPSPKQLAWLKLIWERCCNQQGTQHAA
jgi:hypothetical protein